MDKVSIVIVNWNTGPLLARCLESLAALPNVERSLIDEVIVVDNASSDRSVVQAQAVVGAVFNKPRVRFILQKHNLGFAAANNAAWQRIAQRYPQQLPHILLLNPDTEICAGALAGLLTLLSSQPTAGIAGPQLVNPDGTVQPSVRSFPTLGVFVFLFLKLHRLVPSAVVWQRYVRYGFDYQREQAVDQVMGAVFLIRSEAAQELGRLDEQFFIWFEEVDYCRRAASAGWQTWYTPQARVVHHGGVSFAQLIGWRRAWAWLRSSRQYAAKHLGPMAAVALRLLTPVALLLALPAGLYHRMIRPRAPLL